MGEEMVIFLNEIDLLTKNKYCIFKKKTQNIL